MKLNNKGFTLVEILAVLVILVAIMAVAIPSITSSIERSKEKQNKAKIKMLESFAEVYVTNHRYAVDKNLKDEESCYIEIDKLKKESYFKEDAVVDADGEEIKGIIVFTKPNTYKYQRENFGEIKNSCYEEEN